MPTISIHHLALSAALLFASSAGAATRDGMAERTQACIACHGAQGKATSGGYYPRIAGKSAGYLYNQLRGFRDGQRNYPAMRYLLAHLSDDYLREMAVHFAEMDLPSPAPQAVQAPAAVLARGRQLAMQGDPARKTPACIACHGASLAGIAPAIPGLLGLPRDYISAQFGAWRTGARKAAPPDCMLQVSRQLSNEDVTAVAAWLAAQPVAARTAPAPDGPLPLPCGSAP